MSRQHGKIVRFEDPFGEVVAAEEFVVRWDDSLEDVRRAYGEGLRVSVDLAFLAPEDRTRTADQLDEIVTEDDGELWQLDDQAWLLTPRHPRTGDPDAGPWPAGDRAPRIPGAPRAGGSLARTVPDDDLAPVESRRVRTMMSGRDLH